MTPDAGFSVSDIVVTCNDKALKLSDGGLVQVKKDGKPVEGLYELKEGLDKLSDGAVTVSASFNRKSIGIYAGENDKAEDYTLSEKNAAKGDKVTVLPRDDKLRAGYKVTKVTVTDASGKTVAESSDGAFTVPKTPITAPDSLSRRSWASRILRSRALVALTEGFGQEENMYCKPIIGAASDYSKVENWLSLPQTADKAVDLIYLCIRRAAMTRNRMSSAPSTIQA